MVSIKSNKTVINQSSEEVYNYLSIPENYRILMPSKVRSFESTAEAAKLDIEGIGVVELAFTTLNAPNFIELKPQNKVPFEFNLQWEIKHLDNKKTEVQATINAKLNFMMKMMAEKVLKDFLDVQVHKLTKHLND
jgi:carbon monoxide dehydrogenase subunit G